MAKVNPQEKQARLSVIMAAFGGLFTIAALFFTFQRFNFHQFEIPYVDHGLRMPAILGSCGLGALLGTIGFFAGLNSAGHKRNKLSHLSWAGFFSNAAIVTLALSTAIFFWLVKERIATG